MRIGYFASSFPYRDPRTDKVLTPYAYGGVENGTYQLAKQMAKRNHDVFVFTTSSNGRNSYEEYDNIHIYRYGKNFSIGRAPISLVSLYKPIISDIKLDIAHARLGNLPVPLTGYWYSKRHSIPCVVSYHGDWDGSFGSFSRRLSVFLFNNLLCDYILSNADKIIALSEEHAHESKFLSKYLDNMVFIPNGLNLEEFEISYTKEECRENLGLPGNAKILLFLGSLTSIKAPDVLVKSMKIVLDSIPDAYLVIAGEGSMKQALIELVETLGLGASIRFPGFVSDYKTQYYKAADVFVLPSRHEAFPNVLLEASASGLPIVVSDIPSVRAIVHEGYNGLFAQIGDEVDVAQKIVYLLLNEEVRRELGMNARTKCEKFTWDAVATKTEQLYRSLLNG